MAHLPRPPRNRLGPAGARTGETWRSFLLALLLLVSLVPSIDAGHGSDSVTVMDATLPLHVQSTSAVWDGQRYAYIFAGSWSEATVGSQSRLITRYEPATDTTTLMPTVIQPGREATSAVWDPRDLPALGCPGGCAYIFGGSSGPLKDEILRYNPATNSIGIIARLPTARFGTAAVWAGEYALVFGGVDDVKGSLGEIVRFDPTTFSVRIMNATLPLAHYSSAVWMPTPSSACPLGCAYIFGGVQGAGTTFDHIVRYDPVADRATVMGAKLSPGRFSAAAFTDGRFAYLIGGAWMNGTNGDHLDTVARYDSSMDASAILAARFPKTIAAASGIWDGSHAYVFGGFRTQGDEAEVSNAIVRYHPGASAPPVARFEASVEHSTVSVNAAASYDPEGGALSYLWDWGDGTTSSGAAATHTYSTEGTYTVRLSVEDVTRLRANTTRTVETRLPPNLPPVAVFSLNANGLTVTVDAADSHDSDGTLASYAWTWGDGTSGTGTLPTATHTYAAGGTYTISLMVKDDRSAYDFTTRVVTVTAPPPPSPPPPSSPPAPPPNAAPVAAFAWTLNGQTLAVDAGASSDPDGTLTTYAWSWGEGTTGTGRTATHTYTSPGTYTVHLTVTDNGGKTATTTRTVTIQPPPSTTPAPPTAPAPPPNQAPTAIFTLQATGLNVTADARPSNDPDGTISTYAWTWGDGTTATGPTANHTYAKPGPYTVRLVVTDERGARASTARQILLDPDDPAPATHSDHEPETTPPAPEPEPDEASPPPPTKAPSPPSPTPATPPPTNPKTALSLPTGQATREPPPSSPRLEDENETSALPHQAGGNNEVNTLATLTQLTALALVALASHPRKKRH